MKRATPNRKRSTSPTTSRTILPQQEKPLSTQPPLVNFSKRDSQIFEKELLQQGYQSIAGIDEAGRGCLAGPVVAAAVILKWNDCFYNLRDSKKLSAKQRDYFYDLIVEKAESFGVGIVDSKEIDRINILQAALKAMQNAINDLRSPPDFLLIDGRDPVSSSIPQKSIPKGDDLSFTIGAASVIAKVTRDRMMVQMEKEYPAFRFSIHKGYGTQRHWEELKAHGPTSIHRVSFRGVQS